MDLLKKTAEYTLSQATACGADRAQCFVKESETREFNVDGGEFSLFRTLFDRSLSVTVYKDGRKGSVSVNRFDDASVCEAVKNCIASAESASPDDAWEIAPGAAEKDFVQGAPEPDVEKLFSRSRELVDDIKKRHPLIMLEQMIVYHTSERKVYASTNKNLYTVRGGKYYLEIVYSGHEGEKSSSFFGSGTFLDNLDLPFIECAQIERELSDIERQIYTKSMQGKFEGTVVFTPGCLAETVFGSICGCFASDGVILDGTSIWKDKLGQKVADERINVSFNPHDKRIVCGELYNNDGYISEDYDFIKDGVLQSFRLSQYVANKTGNKRAPNGSFALVVAPGEKSVDEIIAGIDKGLLVGRFSGGEPGTNGEFSGVAKNGFFIENGRLADAISETMISGNLADILNRLVGISKETLADGGMVVPYMAFDGITISGK